MDQKVQLLADWQTKFFSITDLSQKYSISRKTVYKWLNRYEQQGAHGLYERSRRPKYHPSQTDKSIIDMIITQKLKKTTHGPKKIIARLKDLHPHIQWPASSTAGDILKKHGLVKKRKKRLRVPPYTEPFADCDSPNAVWSADYKGQFYTGNGSLCYPATISDNYSRFLIACEGLPGPRYQETRDVFEKAFIEYGLPDAIRTDNGTPFAGRCAGGLSRLSLWWIKLGITPELIKKGCPQENPRHERMHRTLKEDTLNPIATTRSKQQKKFDLFRVEYNTERPHESLGQEYPSKHYKASRRTYIQNPVIPPYDINYTVRKVRSSGDFRFKCRLFYITELLQGEYIGLKEVDNSYWKVYYGFYPICAIDLRKNKIIR
jgi:transposase InsO family protein